MSLHVRVEPMPDNPARYSCVGDRSGQWRVVVNYAEKQRSTPLVRTSSVYSDRLPYQQAAIMACQLQTELGSRSDMDFFDREVTS